MYPSPFYRSFPTSSGFTLVELVTTVVIAAILGIGVISFIGDSARGLVMARNQNQLAADGRAVLARLGLELYNAVPNSIRIAPAGTGDQCLEFIAFTHASTYVDAPFSQLGDTIDMVATNPDAIAMPSGAQIGRYVALYPIVADELYDLAVDGPLTEVAVIDALPGNDDIVRLTLADEHVFPRRSPLERLFLSGQPVSICVEQELLVRYEQYGFHAVQCQPDTCLASGTRALLADNLNNDASVAFAFAPGTLQRNGLLQVDLRFRKGDTDLDLHHEVLLRNVP